MVYVGESLSKEFTISNQGTAMLSGSISENYDFISINEGLIFNVAPGKSKTYTVTFAPLAEKPYSGSIKINSNDEMQLKTVLLTSCAIILT